MHFNESTAGENKTTSTPWIAFISCDLNETTSSNYWGTFPEALSCKNGVKLMRIWFCTDIFTLARDRGAIAAVRLPFSFADQLLIDRLIISFCTQLHRNLVGSTTSTSTISSLLSTCS